MNAMFMDVWVWGFRGLGFQGPCVYVCMYDDVLEGEDRMVIG